MAERVLTQPTAQLRYEPTARRVRGRVGDHTVIDSRRALLIWEPGRVVPSYAFPRQDVRTDLLRESPGDGAVGAPSASGEPAEAAARRGAWDLDVDGRVVEGAAWGYADPDLGDVLGFRWGALERWYEEDEEMLGHPRDPHHRVDVLRSSRHVRVELDGEVLAQSRQPRLLFETGLPTRYYLPSEDVRSELLVPSDTHTICPYKGVASYWSVRLGDRLVSDIAWFYPDPIPEMPKIRDLVAFFNERVDLAVDGKREGRPRTQWSAD